MKRIHFLGVALSAVVALALPTAGAQAQTEPIILKVEHFMPAGSTANLGVVTPWCDNVEAASAGRLKCEIYPSMQLGGKPAQLPDLLRNGVIDVIWTGFGYSAGVFPRTEVMELPFLIPQDMHLANQILWEYMTTYGSDDVKDYKLLGVFSDGGGAFHTSRKAIASLDDLNGLRIRASTRMVGKFISSLDAAPISMPPSQIADSISKGVMDGVLGVWELLPPTKLDETTFYHTEPAADQLTTAITPLTMMMNKDRYESLSEDLKKIIDEQSGPVLNAINADAWTVATAKVRDTIIAAPDHHTITMDTAFFQAMKKKTAPVIDEWVAQDGGEIDRAALLAGLKEIVAKHAPGLD